VLVGLATATGMAAEWVGTRSGAIFGGLYVYHGTGWKLASVPLDVPLFWAVFIYAGYSLNSAALCWLGAEKPSRHRRGAGWLLGLLVLGDAAEAECLDASAWARSLLMRAAKKSLKTS